MVFSTFLLIFSVIFKKLSGYQEGSKKIKSSSMVSPEVNNVRDKESPLKGIGSGSKGD